MSEETDFTKTMPKVGDTVYLISEEAKVVRVVSDGFRLDIDSPWIGFNGRLLSWPDSPQVVFWQPVNITPPPRPKRKVVKTVERWMVLFEDGSANYYKSHEDARLTSKRYDYVIVHLTGQYETEE